MSQLTLDTFNLSDEDHKSLERMRGMFKVLEEMTHGIIDGDVTAMVVHGPPGLGKTYLVEKALKERANEPIFAGDIFSDTFQHISDQRFRMVSGYMKPVHLYKMLYETRHAGMISVFDDCDSVLKDGNSLNLLKAALDTGDQRDVSYNSEAALLREEKIPLTFEYKAGAIFITNVDFVNDDTNMKQHLDAILSRCHYVDLSIKTNRDKFLWMLEVVINGKMLQRKGFTDTQAFEILDFIDKNFKNMQELSLRMVLKIANLMILNVDNWRELAKVTCMRSLHGHTSKI